MIMAQKRGRCDLRVNEYTASQKGLLGRVVACRVIRKNENPA
jgi:hypothetical protein